jgi:tRNA(adenine34) deaminase
MEERDFMQEALKEAKAAYDGGEYPIGAVIVYQGEIQARGRNAEDANFDPTAHAEIVAIRKACKELQAPKLRGCALYPTIYRCPMCDSSIVAAKIERVMYGGHSRSSEKWGRPPLATVATVGASPLRGVSYPGRTKASRRR